MNIGPAGPIVTLTGNTGGAVPPDGAGNIDIVGAVDSFVTVTGTIGTNTLEISLLNELVATITTVDDVPTSVPALLFPISAGRAVFIAYEVIAAFADYSEMFNGVITQGVIRDAINPAVLQAGQDNTFTTGFAGTPATNVQLIGNSVDFQVIGVAATTINWKIVLRFLSI